MREGKTNETKRAALHARRSPDRKNKVGSKSRTVVAGAMADGQVSEEVTSELTNEEPELGAGECCRWGQGL